MSTINASNPLYFLAGLISALFGQAVLLNVTCGDQSLFLIADREESAKYLKKDISYLYDKIVIPKNDSTFFPS